MAGARIAFGIGRISVIVFVLLSSIYIVLAYIPFTYQQVIKGDLLPWFTWFARVHPKLYWAALAVACATLAPDFRRRGTRLLAVAFAAVHAGAGVLLQSAPLLARSRAGGTTLFWAFVSLSPLLWIALIDWIGYSRRIEWAGYRKEDDNRIFLTALESAVFVSLVYCCIFFLRASVTWGPAERAVALFATTMCHVLVFGVLFAALNLVRSIASLMPRPSMIEFLLCNALVAGIGWVIVKTLVFRPVSFAGPLADAYAGMLAGTLIACIAGISVRLWQPGAGPAEGLALAMSPLTLPRFSNRILQPLPLVLLAGFAAVLAMNTAIMDWNYMIQKLTALIVWVLTFALIYAMAPRLKDRSDHRGAILFGVAIVLTGYRLGAAAISPYPAVGAELEKYAGYDVSFRLIRDMLSAPPMDDTLYRFLAQSTNIARSAPVTPVDVELAGKLAPTSGPKPHVFMIVIDSLRRDYLSPYNSAVTFTPAIDAFARESVVFRNTFTRYGGTGLAEPSIWVGGMTLHKQYVMPFYPMNALEKLLESERYQNYISMDVILSTILKPSSSLVPLDENRANMDYRLAQSLNELEARLSQRKPAAAPIFAYTQPQDIHISVINREKNNVVDGGSYGGFYAPYASRLHLMDAGFGKFIDFLKARGLYDNSVVVLTADHGDSLGEEGHWGHAYALVPEVVRVPLIVHLPRNLQGLYYDARAVAFQSDITPTLYYLLGHKPTLHSDFYGRPLFTEKAEEQQPFRRESHLIAASYAAVYAILGNYGKSLYVSDAVNYKDSYWELSDSGATQSSMVSASQKTTYDDLIRKQITAINQFYKFTPAR
jgi:hypothetical protein